MSVAEHGISVHNEAHFSGAPYIQQLETTENVQGDFLFPQAGQGLEDHVMAGGLQAEALVEATQDEVLSGVISEENHQSPQWSQETSVDYLLYHFQENQGRLTAYLLSSHISRSDVEDALQTIYERAHRGIQSFNGGNISAWLYRIARNYIIDRKRHDNRIHMNSAGESDFDLFVHDRQAQLYRQTAPSPEQIIFTRESEQEAVDNMANLVDTLADKDRFRKTVNLVESGITYSQVDQVFGSSEGTTKSYMFRRRAELRKIQAQRFAT